MGTRENILATLATRLATATDVVTVKRCLLSEVELRRYTREQLPMVIVVEPDEAPPDYTPGQHAVNHLEVVVLLVYEQWDWDGAGPTQVNALRDGVVEKTHADIRNGGYSHNTSASGYTSERRDFPLFVDSLKITVDWYASYLTR